MGPNCTEEYSYANFRHKTETTLHFHTALKWVLRKIYEKTNCYRHQKLCWGKPNTSATYDVKLEAVYCVLAPTVLHGYDQRKQTTDYWPMDDLAQMVMITPCIEEVSSLNYG